MPTWTYTIDDVAASGPGVQFSLTLTADYGESSYTSSLSVLLSGDLTDVSSSDLREMLLPKVLETRDYLEPEFSAWQQAALSERAAQAAVGQLGEPIEIPESNA